MAFYLISKGWQDGKQLESPSILVQALRLEGENLILKFRFIVCDKELLKTAKLVEKSRKGRLLHVATLGRETKRSSHYLKEAEVRLKFQYIVKDMYI